MSEQFKGRNYKTAAELGIVPQATISRIEPDMIMVPEPKQPIQRYSTPTVAGSHTDKARGFMISMVVPAVFLGVALVLLLAWIDVLPILSLGSLVIVCLIFSVVMILAYCRNQTLSPDGVALRSVELEHDRLMDQQKFMQGWFKEQYQNEQ